MTVAFGEQWPLKPSSATFAEVSIEDCDAIGHEVGAGDTGLTPDEASVLKLLLDECGALEDVLAHPEHLVDVFASLMSEFATTCNSSVPNQFLLSMIARFFIPLRNAI